jgi:hypothetical protein
MKFLFILGVIFSYEARALEAVVRVLETPLFKEKSYDSPVVQYLRKGDVIKIHPSVGNITKYDDLAPPPQKLRQLRKDLAQTSDWKEDPLFQGKSEAAYLEDEFIPTLDRQGNTAYVLSEHIYVYFNDSREFKNTRLERDPTDYRLEEPLPKDYPLESPNGYRGQFLLGFTQPYSESYPYLEDVKTKGYRSPVDVTVNIARRVSYDKQDRFFFGGTVNLKAYENRFNFFNNRSAQENGFKIGVGPYISYDAFKGEKNRLGLMGALNVYLFNQINILQSNGTIKDDRLYRSNSSLAPRIGLQYHRKGILEEIDFVLGTHLDFDLPATFQAKNAGSQATWWQSIANDKFRTRATFSLAGFLGIQSAY